MNTTADTTRELTLAPEANGQQSLPFPLSGSQRKTAFALRENCEVMIRGNARGTIVRRYDEKLERVILQYVAVDADNLNCTGFLTLTVGDLETLEDGAEHFKQVWDAKEASRRINNLNRYLLPTIFERAILVSERHRNGAVHFHLVGVLVGKPDIRTGFDFEAMHKASNARSAGAVNRSAEIRYKLSASDDLRALWQLLREELPKFGFGRAQLTPLEKTGEAISRYIAKYIEKHICNRLKEDKHKKLVRYLGWEKSQLKPNDFAWGSKRAVAWRWKAREVAALIEVETPEEAKRALGPRWAFSLTLGFKRFATDPDNPKNWVEWETPESRDQTEAMLIRWQSTEWALHRMAKNFDFSDAPRVEFQESMKGYHFEGALADPDYWKFIKN